MPAGETRGRWRRAWPFIAAGMVVIAVAGMALTFWVKDSSRVDDFAPEETVLDYLGGYNFVTHGFIARGLLTDHSLDFSPEDPPVYYTHMPPLPIIIIGGLISAGVDTLPSIRLVMIIVFILGLTAVLAFFWRLLTPWHGIAVVGLLALNAYHVFPMIDHTTHAYWPGLFFLVLWAVARSADRQRFLWLAAATLLVVSWMNYIQLLVLVVTLAGLWVVRLSAFTLKRVLILAGVAAGGVLTHVIQNVAVLGPSVAWHDIIYSVGNRVFGQPTREVLRAFSQDNNLILWGVNSGGHSGNPLVAIWAQFSPLIVAVLLPLAGLGALAYLRRGASRLLALRLLAAFFLAALSFYLVLPAAAAAYPLPFVIAVPVAMTGGLFIGEGVTAARSFFRPSGESRARLVWGGMVALVVVIAAVTVWQTIAGTWPEMLQARIYNRDFAAPEMTILNDFKGEVFWTNITPHEVAYFTRAPVIGQISFEAFKQRDITRAYVVPVNRQSPAWQRVSNPRYFFFGCHHVQPDNAVTLREFGDYLAANYPVIAWSANRYPLIVDISAGPAGTSRLITGEAAGGESRFPAVELSASMLTVSSAIDPRNGAGALVQPGSDGYWHLITPREEDPAWINISLPRAVAIAELRLRSRTGQAEQMWDGNRAVLLAGQNGTDWHPLGVLGVNRGYLADGWISFPVFSTAAYRYYRLEIHDMTFLSLGRLAMTEIPSGTVDYSSPQLITGPDGAVVAGIQGYDTSGYTALPLAAAQLDVSSVNQPTQGKDNLVRPGTDGYWHVKIPREENPAWVSVNLTAARAVALLRILPRSGVTRNLWDGAKARLEASDDRETWKSLATLALKRDALSGDWISFPLPEPESHRYYRLVISDTSFYSFARLEFYTRE
jgi:hypothetical protein